MSNIAAEYKIISCQPRKSVTSSSSTAFAALLLRDLTVLKKGLGIFIARTLIQPFLLVFVFLFVFPQIGQGIGSSGGLSGESTFATILVAGVVALSERRHGVQAQPPVQSPPHVPVRGTCLDFRPGDHELPDAHHPADRLDPQPPREYHASRRQRLLRMAPTA